MEKEMRMKATDIDLVQASFAAIYARKAEVAERFYIHLFSLMPEVEALFGRDFSKQKEMFASMLTYCIKGLADRNSLDLAGDGLAKTHARLRLGARETEIAGRAVMAALEDVMGETLNVEQRAAWQRAITRVMQMMDTSRSTQDCPDKRQAELPVTETSA